MLRLTNTINLGVTVMIMGRESGGVNYTQLLNH